MSDDINVRGPVEIKDSSKERVAYDLMVWISHTGLEPFSSTDDVLNLYARCLNTVIRSDRGAAPASYK